MSLAAATIQNPIPLLILFLLVEIVIDKGPPSSPVHIEFENTKPSGTMSIDKVKVSSWIENSILLRPVFTSGRRLSRLVTAENVVHHVTRLSGIIFAENMRCAIIAVSGVNESLVVTEGSPVGDTYVSKIRPFEIVLANGTVLKTGFDPELDHLHGQTKPSGSPVKSYPSSSAFNAFSLRLSGRQFLHVR
jgi:hypothetical protein